MMNTKLIVSRIEESIDVKKQILNSAKLLGQINTLASEISRTLKDGGKILLCGNGGSASDALHFAGEIVGRFQKERQGWPAIVLNADVATMTAISNDYGYENVYARQVKAQMISKDMLIGISTGGNSANIIKATACAKEIGGRTVILSGKDGGMLKEMADISIIIPSEVTARIQEGHIMIIHILCELIENMMTEE